MLFLVNSHFQAFLGLDEAGRPAKEKSRTEAVEKKIFQSAVVSIPG